MKITVLNGSPRKNGNTEIMVNEFARGAKDAGHEVDIINLAGKKIVGCLGCAFCRDNDGECVQKDDMQVVYSSIKDTDMLVLASPIYWFDVTAQIKCAIDRLYAKGVVGFNFKKSALLLDSAAEGVFDAAITMYKMMHSYLQWEDMGIITIPGMEEKGSMKNSNMLPEVYKLGASLK